MTYGRQPDLSVYRRLIEHTRPSWGNLLALCVLGLAAAPIALLGPLPLKIVVDSALGGQPLPAWIDSLLPVFVPRSPSGMTTFAALLVVVVALVGHSRSLASGVLSISTAERLQLRFRALLFRHMQRASLSYHESRGSADSLYRISWDAQALPYVAIHGVIPLLTALATLVVILGVTATLDWQLAVVGLGIAPPLFLCSHVYQRRLRANYGEAKEFESGALSVIQEAFGALRVVKAFGQEDREEARFLDRAGRGMHSMIRLSITEGRLGLLVGMTTAIGTALTLFIGTLHVRSGQLTMGELLLIMSYLAQLYAPLTGISHSAAYIQKMLGSLERAFQLLDKAPEVPERPHARPLHRVSGNIRFSHVSFGYSGRPDVLHDVSFEAPAGSRLGLSGTTGSGKTTLVNLLMRFYDPRRGQIFLDGVDLRECCLADLRAQFSLVLQEPVLFATSIAENIAYARPEATREEVAAAAAAANAHDFISQLPAGYDTVVGERGMQLSGGERQRIALARAFLKDAPILILDEPTSSVDTRTEDAIMDALGRLMQGRTTLMIAHRLGTLAHCDVRLQIEHGRIVANSHTAAPVSPAHDVEVLS